MELQLGGLNQEGSGALRYSGEWKVAAASDAGVAARGLGAAAAIVTVYATLQEEVQAGSAKGRSAAEEWLRGGLHSAFRIVGTAGGALGGASLGSPVGPLGVAGGTVAGGYYGGLVADWLYGSLLGD